MSAVTITLGSKTKSLENGESYTFDCAGKMLSVVNNLSITFHSVGYFTYAGLTTIGQDEKVRTLKCAGRIMATSIVVTAGEYGDNSSPSSPPSPLPVEITTETEMTALLTNATTESIGAIYKYTGETTDTYENGELYILAEEND